MLHVNQLPPTHPYMILHNYLHSPYSLSDGVICELSFITRVISHITTVLWRLNIIIAEYNKLWWPVGTLVIFKMLCPSTTTNSVSLWSRRVFFETIKLVFVSRYIWRTYSKVHITECHRSRRHILFLQYLID